GNQLAPAERRSRPGELLRGGPIVLFGVECTVLADGVAEQQVKDRPRREAEFAVAVHRGAGVGLVLVPNGRFGFTGQAGGGPCLDLLAGVGAGVGLLLQDAGVPGPVPGDLVGPEDQAGEGVPWVADPGNVAPGIGRVAAVDADRIAVTAADRLVLLVLL